MPLARVMCGLGEGFRPRALANRVRSSPMSARIRAPKTVFRPGKLLMISAFGCWLKAVVSDSPRRAAAGRSHSSPVAAWYCWTLLAGMRPSL